MQENGDESFTVRLRLGGNPGHVHLHVRDSAGPESASKLQTDRLDIMLEAGPPSCIMFDAPNLLSCGTNSTLGELRVKATDEYGNKAVASFEVGSPGRARRRLVDFSVTKTTLCMLIKRVMPQHETSPVVAVWITEKLSHTCKLATELWYYGCETTKWAPEMAAKVLLLLQVALLPSAVSTDGAGQAACVSAANGNKARIKSGVGVFKDVHLTAEQPGQYTLKAKPSSREVQNPAFA